MFYTYLIYFSTLILAYILSYYNKNLKTHRDKLKSYNLLALIPVILIASIKSYNVGKDAENYYLSYLFIDINDVFISQLLDNLIWQEPLFFILNWVFRYFDFHYLIFLTTINIFIWFYIFNASKIITYRFYDVLFCSITFGFLFFTFNGVRQAIAFSIVLYSIKFFLQEKYYKTFTLFFISFLIHYSIIILIPFLFIAKKIKLNFNILLTIIFSSFLISNKIIYTYIQSFSAYFFKYSKFFSLEAANDSFSYGVIVNLIIMSLPLLYHKKLYNISKLNRFCFNMSYFGLILYILFFDNPLISRFIIYFYFIGFFTYSLILSYLSKNKLFFNKGVIYFFLLIVFGLKIFVNESGCCPYEIFTN